MIYEEGFNETSNAYIGKIPVLFPFSQVIKFRVVKEAKFQTIHLLATSHQLYQNNPAGGLAQDRKLTQKNAASHAVSALRKVVK